MAVRASQFGREMDKASKGKSLQANVRRAKKVSSVTRKPDRYDKPSMLDRIILAILRARKKKRTPKKKKGK